MSDTLVKHELTHEDVHTLSVGILNSMMEEEISPEMAIAGLAMTLGRMLSPEMLGPEAEVEFVQALTEWGSMYFMSTNEQVN